MTTIVFVNNKFANGVNVDARTGNFQNPDENPDNRTFFVPYQKSYTLDNPENKDVFWRRDKDQDQPDGTFAKWNQEAVNKEGTYRVELL